MIVVNNSKKFNILNNTTNTMFWVFIKQDVDICIDDDKINAATIITIDNILRDVTSISEESPLTIIIGNKTITKEYSKMVSRDTTLILYDVDEHTTKIELQ